MHPVLSVVVPVYNEEDVLPLLVDRLRPVLDGTGATYEVVAVDDGSKDASAVIMQRIRRSWPQFRIVRLRANAGHQAAISAGLHRARGDYMVTIDADLQDPPETIASMLALAREEHLDVVYGVRNDRSSDTAFKRGTAQAFYATMRRLSGTDAPANAGDFRLMSRATVDAVNALPEHHRVLRLVVPALGFPSGEVYFKREERAAGESKYPLSKMVALSVDSLTAGSMAPLRFATWAGIAGVIGALAIMIYALVSSATANAVAGWTSTVMVVAAVGAVQLLSLGILGEYVGRMYSMMQGRPTYFVAHDTAGETDRDFTTELADEDEVERLHSEASAQARATGADHSAAAPTAAATAALTTVSPDPTPTAQFAQPAPAEHVPADSAADTAAAPADLEPEAPLATLAEPAPATGPSSDLNGSGHLRHSASALAAPDTMRDAASDSSEASDLSEHADEPSEYVYAWDSDELPEHLDDDLTEHPEHALASQPTAQAPMDEQIDRYQVAQPHAPQMDQAHPDQAPAAHPAYDYELTSAAARAASGRQRTEAAPGHSPATASTILGEPTELGSEPTSERLHTQPIMIDAEARQAVRRTSANRLTPGSEDTGR